MEFRKNVLNAIVGNMRDEMEIGRAVGPFSREKEHAVEIFSTVTILGVDEPTAIMVENILKEPDFKTDLSNALDEDIVQIAFNSYDVTDNSLLIVNTIFAINHVPPVVENTDNK